MKGLGRQKPSLYASCIFYIEMFSAGSSQKRWIPQRSLISPLCPVCYEELHNSTVQSQCLEQKKRTLHIISSEADPTPAQFDNILSLERYFCFLNLTLSSIDWLPLWTWQNKQAMSKYLKSSDVVHGANVRPYWLFIQAKSNIHFFKQLKLLIYLFLYTNTKRVHSTNVIQGHSVTSQYHNK